MSFAPRAPGTRPTSGPRRAGSGSSPGNEMALILRDAQGFQFPVSRERERERERHRQTDRDSVCVCVYVCVCAPRPLCCFPLTQRGRIQPHISHENVNTNQPAVWLLGAAPWLPWGCQGPRRCHHSPYPVSVVIATRSVHAVTRS